MTNKLLISELSKMRNLIPKRYLRQEHIEIVQTIRNLSYNITSGEKL